MTGEQGQRSAAVIRRGHERERRDLFGEQHEAAPSSAPPSRVGERNENSVLFSVSMLQKEAEPTTHSDDDGGIVDLKAIAEATGSSLLYKPLKSDPPPDVAYAKDVFEMPAAIRTLPLRAMAFAGLVTAALTSIGLVVLLSSGPAPQPSSGGASFRSSILGEAHSAPRAFKGQKAMMAVAGPQGKVAGARNTFASTGASPTPKVAAVKTAPKPPSDPCHCHGALQCVIRCSATGH